MTAEEAEKVRESRLKAAEETKEMFPAKSDNQIVTKSEASGFSKGLKSIINGKRRFEEARVGDGYKQGKGAVHPTPSTWLE